MQLPGAVCFTLLSGVTMLAPTAEAAQDYPNRPIRIVATEAGGSGDTIIRLLTPPLAATLGQPIVIDNRPGATISGEIVAKAAPDGHTLLIIGSSFWIAPFLQKMPYDPIKDFSPVILVTSAPVVLSVHPSVAAKSVTELIALAKAKPGALNCSTTQVGGAIHLGAELFKSMANVNIVGVPYKGTAPALNAVIGGEVQLMFAPPGAVMPQVKAGKLRALAVSSAQPSLLAPGLPTIDTSGLPGYELSNSNGVFAPAKMPSAIVSRLNAEMAREVARNEIREKLINSGFEPVGGSPAVFATKVKSDMSRLGKVIRDARIRVE